MRNKQHVHSLLTYKCNVPFMVISFLIGGGQGVGVSHALRNFRKGQNSVTVCDKMGEGSTTVKYSIIFYNYNYILNYILIYI